MTELMIERSIDVTDIALATGDGWTLRGRIVPFGQRQEVRDTPDGPTYLERFDRHAFDRDAAKGGRWVMLRVGHYGPDSDAFLGRCLGLDALDDGLYGTFRITERDHPQADAARSGELRGWSVGSKVYRSAKVSDPDERVVVERRVCAINHVAATPQPQYAGAGVLMVRDHELRDETRDSSAGRWRDELLAELRAARAARG